MPRVVARPSLPTTLLITATELSDEVHVATRVTSAVVPSDQKPDALNCTSMPMPVRTTAGAM